MTRNRRQYRRTYIVAHDPIDQSTVETTREEQRFLDRMPFQRGHLWRSEAAKARRGADLFLMTSQNSVLRHHPDIIDFDLQRARRVMRGFSGAQGGK
jgi:hypothetical protein